MQHKPTGRKRYKNVAADKLYRQCHGHGSDTAQDRQQTGKNTGVDNAGLSQICSSTQNILPTNYHLSVCTICIQLRQRAKK